MALCPYLSAAGWLIDITASFAAQAAMVTLPLDAWWLLRRRWKCAAVAGLALGLHAMALIPGRAAWGDPRPGSVRILQYNASTSIIGQYEPERQLVLDSGADVVILAESMGQI